MKTSLFNARDQHRVSLCFIIFLGFSIDSSRGYVRLNPVPAQVCVGRQLEITCTTNETALLWNFVPHLMDNQGASVQREWLIASEDLTQQLQQFTINSTFFAFRRTSMRHNYPLVSMLTIINSSNALNMINVSCAEVIGVELAMSVLTTIIIVGNTHTGLDLNKIQESRSSHALLTAAVSSSVVAFLVILTSATGVVCGYYFMRRRRRKQSSSSSQPTEPLYEDVILNALPQPSAVEHHLEQGLELKENVAYGTTKHVIHS